MKSRRSRPEFFGNRHRSPMVPFPGPADGRNPRTGLNPRQVSRYDRCIRYSPNLDYQPFYRFVRHDRNGKRVSRLNGRVAATLLDANSPLVDSTSDECDEIRARVCFVVVSPPRAFVVSVTFLQSVHFFDGLLSPRIETASVAVTAESANAPAS